MNRCSTLFKTVFLILINNFLFAQAPTIEWQKALGGRNGEYASSIEATADGGYIVGGYTEGADDGDIMGYHGNENIQDYWILKLDNKGAIEWQKCLGGIYMETGAYIRQTPDGGYVVAGSSASRDCNVIGNHLGLDYWIVKLATNGDIEWQKSIGGSKNEYAYSISLTNDGGYIVAGLTESDNGDVTVNYGDRDYWVVKLDGSGNLVWQKSLGGTSAEEAYAVQATPDGGCVVAGYTASNNGDVTGNHGLWDFWIVKLDNTGNLVWQKSLGGTQSEIARSIQLTPDGGYIVTGFTASNDGNVSGNHTLLGSFADYWVVKLSSDGNIQWQKCYGGNKNELGFFIQLTADGGYIVAGSAESNDGDANCNAGITDVWIIKINNTGTLEWQKSIGGDYYDEAYCIQPTNDGGYIVAGYTCSTNIPGYHPHNTFVGTCADYWVIKLAGRAITQPNPVVVIDPASANVCAGGTATITASVRYGGTNPSYRWERNGMAAGGNSPVYTASDFANNDIVTCYVITGGTCETASLQASDVITIKVNNNAIQPQINITADNTIICECTPVSFQATIVNGGSSPIYQWKLNGENAGSGEDVYISNSLKNGDIINCVYTDNASCVAGGSVVSNSIQIMTASGQSPSISITASTNDICAGSAITFTAATVNAGTNPFYQWKLNGMNVGSNNASFASAALLDGDIVNCTINTDPLFTCVNTTTAISNNITINIVNAVSPEVTISGTNTICSGSPATFTAIPLNAGANPSFQWKVNGANVGTNNITFTSSALADGDIVSCIMNKDPLFTCAAASSATSNDIVMTILTEVIASVNISVSDNEVCKGTTAIFTATANNAGVSPAFNWKLNNTNVGSNSATYSSNTLSNGDQVYCVITPGSNTCSNSTVSSNIIPIIINDLPGISIDPKDTIIFTGSQIQLNATVTGNVLSYQWEPADKLINPFSLTPSTIHLTANTTYTLNAVSNKGCTSSDNVIVKIFQPLYMPNAFTPNGDGINDVFRIPPDASLVLTEFSIFDRWGNKIFTTNSINRGWDGTLNGKPLVSSVYVYFIKGFNEKGNVFLKGNLALIR
jgi:gliding motility-associated-like protein